MISGFESWSANRCEINSLSDLSGAAIAIEASFYISKLLNQAPTAEPLLSALGGFPFAFQDHVEKELQILSTNDITPIFVFDGLDVGKTFRPFRASDDAVKLISDAWKLYHDHSAVNAVKTFGDSGYAKPEDFYRLLQDILRKKKIEFQVAPYSALGQLAYLSRHGDTYIDGVVGSPELLMFDIDKVIINLSLTQAEPEFTFITKQSCLEELGLASPDMLTDAFMLAGSSFLPTVPTLTNSSNRKISSIRAAVDLMKSHGSTGIAVCTHLQDDMGMQRLDYLDRYRRARLAIKHQVILTADGSIEPFAQAYVPNDLHEVVGQRLPEELYYYLSKAVVGPRILNQLTSQQILEMAPVDGGESPEYHALVRDKLTPLRIASLSLLANALHRAFQHRDITLRCWFEGAERTVSAGDFIATAPILDKWHATGEFLDTAEHPFTLRSVALSLADPAFAKETIATRKDNEALSFQPEILFNSFGRFYQLSGYVDEKHELTNWGKVLAEMMRTGSKSTELNEVAVLATELLRLDLLSDADMFPGHYSNQFRGPDVDRRSCLLISRIACLVKLQHEDIGFTGPLNRALLAYSSMINAVRTSLRDVLEMCLVTMFLRGEADRECAKLTSISLDLPFLLPSNCGMGIATKQYLDELASLGDFSTNIKEDIFSRAKQDWFPHAKDVKSDLQQVFKLWDKIYAGVKVAATLGLVNNTDSWNEVNEWLTPRRC